MTQPKTPRLREGHQLYDPINGARVGALTGGLLGAGAVLVLGGRIPWLIVVAALVGGVLGFVVARREMTG